MNRFTRTITTALASAAVSGGLIVAATPASADEASTLDTTCQAEYFCAWVHIDRGGSRVRWPNSDNVWGSTIRNEDSSWWNKNSARYIYVFDGSYQSPPLTLCLRPGRYVNYSANANDRGGSHAESTRVCGT